MPRLVVASAVAKNYLAFARVVAESLRCFHPETPMFVALADEPEQYFDPAVEPFTMVPLAELKVPNLRQFFFQYTRQQVVVAAKAYLLRWLLDRGHDAVLFLDPDILIGADLGPLFDAVARHAITLAPHLLTPVETIQRPEDELYVLRAGVYNGGLVGVSARPEARRFLEWWCDRLRYHCCLDVERGMHLDQRWLDLAPALFENVHLLRDPCCNVAYWNLWTRAPGLKDGSLTLAGQPCRFFHFSGFEPDHPDQPTRYRPKITLADLGPAAPLFGRYARLLHAAGHAQTSQWPYAYDRFHDGSPIPPLARSIYAGLGESAAAFGDPFETERADSFAVWLKCQDEGAFRLPRL